MSKFKLNIKSFIFIVFLNHFKFFLYFSESKVAEVTNLKYKWKNLSFSQISQTIINILQCSSYISIELTFGQFVKTFLCPISMSIF